MHARGSGVPTVIVTQCFSLENILNSVRDAQCLRTLSLFVAEMDMAGHGSP